MKKIIRNVTLTLILTLSFFTFIFKVKAIESIEYIGMENSEFVPISNEEKYIKSEIYYDENGKAEGLNNKIKVIKRVGFGYRNFEFFRLRLMYILNGKISGITKKDRSVKK